jgi:hypothetical protein
MKLRAEHNKSVLSAKTFNLLDILPGRRFLLSHKLLISQTIKLVLNPHLIFATLLKQNVDEINRFQYACFLGIRNTLGKDE